MPSFTKKAIENSFLKLLNETPLSNITVKMIVDDCQINRNSFYYHFQDIPSLVEAIIIQMLDRIIQLIPDDLNISDCLLEISEELDRNKRALLHVWNSGNREIVEKHLLFACDYAVKRYMECARTLEDYTFIQEEDLLLVGDFMKCEFYGQITNWLSQNMSFDIIEHTKALSALFAGTFRSALLSNGHPVSGMENNFIKEDLS